MWNFSQYGNKTAWISDSSGRGTYNDLYYCCEEWNKKFPRSLVLILCKNTPGSLISYIAAMETNSVPILLPWNIHREFLNHIISEYKPNYLCIPKGMAEVFNRSKLFEVEDYQVMALSKEPVDMYEELGLLLSTSGSTGSPKLVRQSRNNVLSNAQQIAEYLEINAFERAITTMPMNYTYGLSIINSHLLKGATLLLTEKTLFEREFWEFFKNEKATTFGAVPYTYGMLKRLGFLNMDLPDLRYFTQAGGKLSKELHEEFATYAKRENKKFVIMYGQTEATARMSYLPWEMTFEKLGSIGIAIPQGKFSIRDENGDIIKEPGVTGELVYEGPNVTLGYATNIEDLTLKDERQGVLLTGDMAYRDKDDYYYIVGRKKRFIKIFGHRINLDEVENTLKREFAVECALAGEDDLLEIYTVDDSNKADMEKYVEEHFRIHPSGYAIYRISEIPKNDAGKIQYRKLKEVFLDEQESC